MKLKRILSLALSGVLAVSMLTACGVGGIGGALANRSSTFRSELNGAQEMLNFRASDRDLSDAIYTVAGTLTEAQAKINGTDSSLNSTVRQLTGYRDLSTGGAWNGADAQETDTYVKVFVYNTDDERYDTMREVADAVAGVIKNIDLKGDAAVAGGVTYSGDVAAYEKTVGTGEEAVHALVIGVAITQTVPAAE